MTVSSILPKAYLKGTKMELNHTENALSDRLADCLVATSSKHEADRKTTDFEFIEAK